MSSDFTSSPVYGWAFSIQELPSVSNRAVDTYLTEYSGMEMEGSRAHPEVLKKFSSFLLKFPFP